MRNAKRKAQGGRGSMSVEVLASLSLGKGVFFVVRCGPDVLAFTFGSGGQSCLMGRWSYEEWCGTQGDEGV